MKNIISLMICMLALCSFAQDSGSITSIKATVTHQANCNHEQPLVSGTDCYKVIWSNKSKSTWFAHADEKGELATRYPTKGFQNDMVKVLEGYRETKNFRTWSVSAMHTLIRKMYHANTKEELKNAFPKSTGAWLPYTQITTELKADIRMVTFTKTVEPEAVEPEAVEPETVEPEAVEPETVEPETVEPETVEPETVEPETVEPETVEPETVEPETVEAKTPEAVDPHFLKELRIWFIGILLCFVVVSIFLLKLLGSFYSRKTLNLQERVKALKSALEKLTKDMESHREKQLSGYLTAGRKILTQVGAKYSDQGTFQLWFLHLAALQSTNLESTEADPAKLQAENKALWQCSNSFLGTNLPFKTGVGNYGVRKRQFQSLLEEAIQKLQKQPTTERADPSGVAEHLKQQLNDHITGMSIQLENAIKPLEGAFADRIDKTITNQTRRLVEEMKREVKALQPSEHAEPKKETQGSMHEESAKLSTLPTPSLQWQANRESWRKALLTALRLLTGGLEGDAPELQEFARSTLESAEAIRLVKVLFDEQAVNNLLKAEGTTQFIAHWKKPSSNGQLGLMPTLHFLVTHQLAPMQQQNPSHPIYTIKWVLDQVWTLMEQAAAQHGITFHPITNLTDLTRTKTYIRKANRLSKTIRHILQGKEQIIFYQWLQNTAVGSDENRTDQVVWLVEQGYEVAGHPESRVYSEVNTYHDVKANLTIPEIR